MVCFIGGTGLTAATAQVQFPVAAPAPKVGDVAAFRTTDLWNKTVLLTTRSELVAIEPSNFVTRFKQSDRDAPTTGRNDLSWNGCTSLRNSDKSVCDGPLRFPMQVGNKHSYKEVPYPNGLGHFSADCVVAGEEKLTVAAGTFDTVRITCAGFYQRVFEGNWNGRFNTVTWYAPSINWRVKSEYQDFNGSSVFNKTQTELTEFIPSK